MLTIQNDSGLSLQLTPGQAFVTELATSWLSDEELPAEFSYPIDCPLNDNNKRFVDHGYRPDRAQIQPVMAVTVALDGVLYRRCQFAYQVKGGKLSGYLKIDSAEVYDKIRKLTLLEALPDVIKLGNGLNDGYTNATTALAARMKVIAGLPPGQFPLTFFPIRNQAFLEDDFSSEKLAGYVRRDYVNGWEGGSFKTDSTASASGYLVVPQLYLWYVLERILALAGYRIESDWLAQDEIQRLVVVNLTAMAVSGLGQGDPAGLLTGHTIVAGNHLPDMAVSDFLKAIKGRFGLNFTYNANDRICTITQFRAAVAAGPSIDLTPFQSGAYDTNEAGGSGYTIRDYVDPQDELYRTPGGETIVPTGFVIGKGQQDIPLKCGTTQQIYEPVPGTNGPYWLVPTLRQAGNVLDKLYSLSERYPDKTGKRKNSIGLKLLSYRGLSAYQAGSVYPLATPDVRDGLQQIVGSQALNLTGRYGAWRTYLRAYFFFRDNTQRITQPLLLPGPILAGLKLGRTVQLSLEDQILRSYLISKVQAQEPGPSGLSPVRLEVLSIPSGLELSADVDEPVVYLEFVEVMNPGPSAQLHLLTLSVKAWTSAAKTAPATLTNLAVTVRTKKTHQTTDTVRLGYAEYQTIYYASGTGTIVLDRGYIGFQTDIDPGQTTTNKYYSMAPSLDPGEGYIILRS